MGYIPQEKLTQSSHIDQEECCNSFVVDNRSEMVAQKKLINQIHWIFPRNWPSVANLN